MADEKKPLNTLPIKTVVKLEQEVPIISPVGSLYSNDTITIKGHIAGGKFTVVEKEVGDALFVNGAKVTEYKIMEEA